MGNPDPNMIFCTLPTREALDSLIDEVINETNRFQLGNPMPYNRFGISLKQMMLEKAGTTVTYGDVASDFVVMGVMAFTRFKENGIQLFEGITYDQVSEKIGEYDMARIRDTMINMLLQISRKVDATT